MPPHTVITTMLGGLLGTVAQSMVVSGVGPLIAGPSLDEAALGGSSCALQSPSWLILLANSEVPQFVYPTCLL